MAAPLAGEESEPRVYAWGDGIPHTPSEYSKLLTTLADSGRWEPDEYSRGGVVEQLETRMAALLGKETAVWLPTGTLANHLAVRALSGSKRRILVQAESHLYRDSGDCAQTLSGLNLIPLGTERATMRLEEVEAASSESLLGRVAAPIGAVQIETPVRRRMGQRFDFGEMKRIAGWARERQIGLHLDGARLFIESVYADRSVKEYAALFDTVYVSLYKYFNAGSGAVLAGPKALLKDLFQARRMFGSGLPHVWPFASVALHYLDGFEASFRAAKAASEAVIAELSRDANFAVERVPNGTNIFRLRVQNVNAPVYQLRLETAGISARPPAQDWFALQVNATWTRVPARAIVERFRRALG
jgi:threonine aldolase